MRIVTFAASLFALAWPAVCQTVQFNSLTKERVMARLERTASDNRERAATLKAIFEEAGCDGDHLEEQAVKHEKAPNVICTWPGTTEQRILVSAHTDKVSQGDGTVDDWSGASLLVDLFESLHSSERHHTFVFIGFTGEEEGLVGSHSYLKGLTGAQKSRIVALINVECLGLSGTAVWLSHADKQLAKVAGQTAAAIKLRLNATNVDRVGLDDAMTFRDQQIPTITFHSVTQDTLSILHSRRDTMRAIHTEDYFDSYRFLAAYLAFLDATLE